MRVTKENRDFLDGYSVVYLVRKRLISEICYTYITMELVIPNAK